MRKVDLQLKTITIDKDLCGRELIEALSPLIDDCYDKANGSNKVILEHKIADLYNECSLEEIVTTIIEDYYGNGDHYAYNFHIEDLGGCIMVLLAYLKQ